MQLSSRRARTSFNRFFRYPSSARVRSSKLVTDQPLDGFALNAVIGAWNEGDVIASTVANAFAQGCDGVYLVDNASTDDTIAQALKAGAELAATFDDTVEVEGPRLALMNDVVAKVSADLGRRHAWWLFLDADEFPSAPRDGTIRDFLSTLDRRFTIVGSITLDHVPTSRPEHVPSFHPIDVQPLCVPHIEPHCFAHHHKHPLVRIDADRPPIRLAKGFHTIDESMASRGADRPLEPRTGLVTHHFPFRDEAATRSRMEDAARRVGAAMPIGERLALLDAVYAGDWANVKLYRGRLGNRSRRFEHWTTFTPEDHQIRRWYDADDFVVVRDELGRATDRPGAAARDADGGE